MGASLLEILFKRPRRVTKSKTKHSSNKKKKENNNKLKKGGKGVDTNPFRIQ